MSSHLGLHLEGEGRRARRLPESAEIGGAGFGDPMGRGGGVEALQAFRGAGPLSGGGIQEVGFTPATFNIPKFENGVLTFKLGSDVPEPASWALMIAGFGLLGAALRRRRILRYT